MPNASTIVKRSWIAMSGLTYVWVNISLAWDHFVNPYSHKEFVLDWATYAAIGIMSIVWIVVTAGIYAILNWITSD